MTIKRKVDIAKWIGVAVAVLGIVTGALAWAISVDTAAGKIPAVESRVERMDRFLNRMAGKWGVPYE